MKFCFTSVTVVLFIIKNVQNISKPKSNLINTAGKSDDGNTNWNGNAVSNNDYGGYGYESKGESTEGTGGTDGSTAEQNTGDTDGGTGKKGESTEGTGSTDGSTEEQNTGDTDGGTGKKEGTGSTDGSTDEQNTGDTDGGTGKKGESAEGTGSTDGSTDEQNTGDTDGGTGKKGESTEGTGSTDGSTDEQNTGDTDGGTGKKDCKEMDTDYFLNDIVPIDQAPTAESWQKCSELCRKKYEECNFWTLVAGKCLVKKSKEGKRNLKGAISGSRECGSNAGESVTSEGTEVSGGTYGGTGEQNTGGTDGGTGNKGENTYGYEPENEANSSGSSSGSSKNNQRSSETPCKADNDDGIDMDIGDGKIYAGFFTRSYGTSGKITFNICKKESTYGSSGSYDCSHPGGEITIFGGSKEKPFDSTLPTKVDITENALKAEISKVDDVRFYVTSIQDTEGKKIEKEVFQPIRVFRPKIRCYDFYTIFFNTSIIHPPAIEITKKVKFKIESLNKKIFQVNTQDDYKKCNEQQFFCMDNKYQLGYNNYKCSIGASNSTKNNTGNIANGNENIKKSNGSYYIFDKDGLPKSCAGGKASNGSKVQIILTEFARESEKYIGSGEGEDSYGSASESEEQNIPVSVSGSGENGSGYTPGSGESSSGSGEGTSGSGEDSYGPVSESPIATTTEKPCKADNDDGIDMDIGDGKIYAGFFTRSYGTSGKITFNICKKESTYGSVGSYDCSHPGGEITIFGGSKEKPFESTLPTKVDVTENTKKAEISKVDDVRFYVTSIQDTEGKKIEKEVFQPIRVFRPKIRCYDFYTIFFNTSVIQPPGIEITKKVKFKIESLNKKIFLVNSQDDYKKCNEQTLFCMDNKYQLGYNNYKCNIGTGNSTEKNTGNIANGNENIKKSNGSYYLFDKDGLPKSCAGGAASNGSKVQIILTEFARESEKYIGSGEGEDSSGSASGSEEENSSGPDSGSGEYGPGSASGSGESSSGSGLVYQDNPSQNPANDNIGNENGIGNVGYGNGNGNVGNGNGNDNGIMGYGNYNLMRNT